MTFYIPRILLSAALVLAGTASAQQPIRGTQGEVLGNDQDFETAVGGRGSFQFAPGTVATPLQRGIYEVRLQNTGTGWEEQMLIALPSQIPGPRPLLVAFHSYGRTPHEVMTDTNLFSEGIERGWIVVAPLGAHKFHYGIEYAQENIRVALDWVTQMLPIDFDRIYGVGFSMGGGAMASYAARHLDPTKPIFAGLVNHTGTTSLRHAHAHVPNPQLLENPEMFGDTPARVSFRYARVSTVDMDAFQFMVRPGDHMVRNLRRTPTWTWRVTHDPIHYLRIQSDVFAERLDVTGGTSTATSGPGNQHIFSTLDEDVVFDYLDPLRRTVPGPNEIVSVVADRSGRWYHFDLVQRGEGFSHLRWYAATGFNRLIIDKLRNVKTITADLAELSLSAPAPLDVILSTADGLPVTVCLSGYQQQPVSVTRSGAPSGSWSWDPSSGEVTIFETNPGSYPSWRIEP